MLILNYRPYHLTHQPIIGALILIISDDEFLYPSLQ